MVDRCRHADVREFDGKRTCLECGRTSFREAESRDAAADQKPEYMYTDLRCLERGQMIRLVLLEPGDYHDPLRCTLVLSELQPYSVYDAISYTWATEDGDGTKSQFIDVDDSILYVTKNCEAALRSVRQVRVRRVWIDAMCVNQSNINERNHQVGLMDRIYQAATNVHICIYNPRTDFAALVDWLWYKDQTVPQAKTLQITDTSDFSLEVVRSQMLSLYHCRYFRRLWVIQEVTLARTLVLHANERSITLSGSTWQRLQKATTRWKIPLPAPLQSIGTTDPSQPFMRQFIRSSGSDCSDPKDKIYAILSILPASVRSFFTVDYSRSVEEVYADAAAVCIAERRDLTILSSIRLEPDMDWRDAPCLSVNEFTEYIKAIVGTNPRGAADIIIRGEVWALQHVIPASNVMGWEKSERRFLPCSSPVEILSFSNLPRQVLPCLRVHVGFIDRSKGACTQHSGLDHLGNADTIRWYTSGRRKSSSSAIFTVEARSKSQQRLYLVAQNRSQVKGFICSYKVGQILATDRQCAISDACYLSREGDRVVSIDGCQHLLLLREVEGSRFRVLGKCCIVRRYKGQVPSESDTVGSQWRGSTEKTRSSNKIRGRPIMPKEKSSVAKKSSRTSQPTNTTASTHLWEDLEEKLRVKRWQPDLTEQFSQFIEIY